MNWDTIAWYSGFCAATTAGFIAVPYVAGYMCPTVKFYAELIKTTWNDFTVFILAHIPSWLVISRDSIGIKLTL